MRRFNFLVLTLGAPATLQAQAALAGVVRDEVTGKPLGGVEIRIASDQRSATTDSLGRFVVAGLRTNASVAVNARRIGYRAVDFEVTPRPDTLFVDIDLVPTPVQLDSVAVEATRVRSPAMTGFEERKAVGRGKFVTPEALRASEHRRLRDVLMGLGNFRFVQGRHSSLKFAINTTTDCPYGIIYNGMWLYRPRSGGIGVTSAAGLEQANIEQWSITDLEAVEVYSSPSTVPLEYGGTGAACGVIVLHGRER